MTVIIISTVGMSFDWIETLLVETCWVSDSHLVFCRVCEGCYSPFDYIAEDMYKEQTVSIDKLYVNDCGEWLGSHDRDTKGNIDELRVRIKR